MKDETTSLKIIQLKIENVMGVTAVEITPEGNTIIISGPNAAGKTSILHSMWLALAGKEAMKANPDPIRHGTDHAKVVVNLGEETEDGGINHDKDIIVTRTWTPKKTNLIIENSEGAVFKSPGAMLASLIGKLSFNPQEFANQSEKEQVQTLLGLIELPIDLAELDAKRKTLYESRTLVNRDINQLTSQRDAIVVSADVPDDEKSSADIMADYQAASDMNVENNNKRTDLAFERETAITLLAQKNHMIEQLKLIESNITKCTESQQEIDAKIVNLITEVDSLVDQDLESFKTRLAEVEVVNEQVREKHKRDDLTGQLQIAGGESAHLTGEIKDIDTLKATTIQEANMPVEGLGFNEDGVTYNDTPIKQCATSEQHRVSIAVGMAVNPKLRVIMIPDASLLDSAYMRMVEEMAIDNNFQVWMEKVDETGNIGIYIEEGEVAKDNQFHPKDHEQAVAELEYHQDMIDEGCFDGDAPPSIPNEENEENQKEIPSLPRPAENKS